MECQQQVRKVRKIIRECRAAEEGLARRAPSRSTASRHVLKRQSDALAQIEEIVKLKR